MTSGHLLRIGELSKRAGVSPELLRAWERRYGLLRPTRSAGGLRLYSPADVERVQLMRQHLADGLAAAEAAAARAAGPWSPRKPRRLRCRPAALRDELADALDRFDEPRAQAILDRLLAVATVDTLLSEVVLPYLRELGERWARGDASVAQEHFASGVAARAAARHRARLGPRARPGGGARLPAGRAARPRPDRVRAGAARARLAHRLPRPRCADRDGRGGRAAAPTRASSSSPR